MVKKVQYNKELASLTSEDLQARIKEDSVRLKKLQFAHAISPLENPMSVRNLKKDIARLKTEFQKKALA